MKFPKPRELKNNEYPDLQEDEPTLLRNLMQLARPSEGSHIDMYLNSTIKFVKEKQRKKGKRGQAEQCSLRKQSLFCRHNIPPVYREI